MFPVLYDGILGTVGGTPLVRLSNDGGRAQIFCKVESFNPMHSVKDRVALFMIEEAEAAGDLIPGSVVVEPTSGNTGIGLAMVCSAKGYRLIIVMPENMSQERQRLMRALGAELVLTPAFEGMSGAVERARKMVSEMEGAYMPQQFSNPSNSRAHSETTAREILEDLPDLDAFVAGVGTGGTITGVGRVLKERTSAQVVAVEPASSPLLSQGRSGPHGIQGIGANFVPSILDMGVVDRILTVTDDEAKEGARWLAREEGILCGISSGAALHASMTVARELGEGRKVVTLLPDSGERYLSTDLFME
ncbi:MAG: cysteine synthase A [Methanomassiliicoccales archaeon]